MKIRVEGVATDVQKAVRKIGDIFPVASVSKPYKNRGNNNVRVYIDILDCGETRVEVLTPSYHGEKCRHSGQHEEYECCCDECDHFLTCFPEYSKKE